MSEPENFLSRWSRRKRVADEAPEQPAPDRPAIAAETPATNSESGDQQALPVSPEPVFDPASLPSIDSIGAQTDISAFLKPGVPSDLRLAALRRAWSADPAIRDFKGLAENDWDFNDPNGMLGFGKLDASTDVKKMLAQLFGETARAHDSATEIPAPDELSAETEQPAIELSSESTNDTEAPESPRHQTSEPTNLLQREENIAEQNKDSESDGEQIKHRRSQGGALPH
jgi:hypothetical protein